MSENNVQNSIPVQDNKQEKQNKNKNKNSKTDSKVLIIILFILMIILIVFGAKSYLGDSIVLFKTVVETGGKQINNQIEKYDKNQLEYNSSDNININSTLSLDSNFEEIATFAGYDYKFDIALNQKAEKLGMNFAILKDNENKLDCFINLIKNMLYIKSEKVYSKVLYTNVGENIFAQLNELEEEQKYNTEDIKKIVDKIAKHIGNGLERDKFTTDSDTIDIAGETIDVTKHEYLIDYDEYLAINKKIYTDIKEDDELITLLAKVTGLTKEEIKEEIDYSIPEGSDFGREYYTNQKLKIYTSGFFSKIVGMEISDDDETYRYTTLKTQSEFMMKTRYETFEMTTKDNVTTGFLKDGDEKVLEFTIKDESKDNHQKYSINYDVPLLVMNGKINVESNKKSNKKIENKLEFDFNSGSGPELQTLKISLNNNLEIGGNLTDISTEESVNVEELSEEEQQLIATNLKNAVVGTPLEIFFAIAEGNMYETQDENLYYTQEDSDAEQEKKDINLRMRDIIELLRP